MSQWCKNGRTPDLQETKSVIVNKTGKVEVHITDNQSWNSCHRVASEQESTFGSAIELTKKKHNALWLFMKHGHLLQPKHCASAVWMHWSSRLLRWSEAWILLGNNTQACPQHHRNNGTRDHQNRILIGPRSRGGWNNRSFGILIGSWPETDQNVHHWKGVYKLTFIINTPLKCMSKSLTTWCMTMIRHTF